MGYPGGFRRRRTRRETGWRGLPLGIKRVGLEEENGKEQEEKEEEEEEEEEDEHWMTRGT